MKKNRLSVIIVLVFLLSCLSGVAHASESTNIPSFSIDSSYISPIESQGNNSLCVAYVVCNAVEGQMRIRGMEVPINGFDEEWLFSECQLLDNGKYSSGTSIETALQVAKSKGLKPKDGSVSESYNYRIEDYSYIYSLDDVKDYVLNNNIVLVTTSSENSNWKKGDGIVLPTSEIVKSKHSTYLIGYDDTTTFNGYTGFCYGVNSWGLRWGQDGMYSMSYNYLNDRSHVKELFVFSVGYNPNIKYVDMSYPMTVINGNTMLPFREVYDSIGGNVDWHIDNNNNCVVNGTIEKDGQNLSMEITNGSNILKVSNGISTEYITMNCAMQVVNGHTMLPLRSIYEYMGGDVSWYSEGGKGVAHVKIPVNGNEIRIEITNGSNTMKITEM